LDAADRAEGGIGGTGRPWQAQIPRRVTLQGGGSDRRGWGTFPARRTLYPHRAL